VFSLTAWVVDQQKEKYWDRELPYVLVGHILETNVTFRLFDWI